MPHHTSTFSNLENLDVEQNQFLVVHFLFADQLDAVHYLSHIIDCGFEKFGMIEFSKEYFKGNYYEVIKFVGFASYHALAKPAMRYKVRAAI